MSQIYGTIKPRASRVNGNIRFAQNTQAVAGDTVWPGSQFGQGVKVFNAGPWGVWISSDDALDVNIDITIMYIDNTTGYQLGATATLNGKTFVRVTDSEGANIAAKHINRAWVSSENDTLAGNVFISSDNTDVGANGIPDDTTKIEAILPTDDQQTMQLIVMVPKNPNYSMVGVLDGWDASLVANSANVNVSVKAKQIPPGGSKRTVDAASGKTIGALRKSQPAYGNDGFAEGTIIFVEVVTASSAISIDGNMCVRFAKA